jgi:hypothetical protein
MFMMYHDMEDSMGQLVDSIQYAGRGQVGGDYYASDMNLVLSDSSDDVTYNATFFGTNF